MPTTNARRRAATKKRQGKAATTQAGEYVRHEMRKMKRGKGNAKSRKQAIAIGLSEARQEGVKVRKEPRSKRQTRGKARGQTSTRKSSRLRSKR